MSKTITLDLTHQWYVRANSTAPPALLALRELQTHWQQITDKLLLHDFQGEVQAEEASIIMLVVADNGTDNRYDEFTWQVHPNQIQIHGQSPRGLLFGVYHFLEMLGCRWLAPGLLWTHIPSLQTIALPSEPITEAPAFTERCLIIGHYAFMREIEIWIEWAARNRYNTIFLHTAPNDIGGGSVPEWAWLHYRERALTLLRERNMTIEVGGHGLPALLPRKLFRKMPQAFREVDGKRTRKHNFCPSSVEAKTVIQENARRYFQENPQIDVYHIWADDIPGDGWCGCVACAALSSSDQLLLATNMIAEVLADVHPQAELSFIAYLDTEAPPTQITPLHNVCLLWAPRTRNYGRATDDEQCPVNTPYYPELLQAQIDSFATAGTIRVFEYYSDALLFKSVLPILGNVMQHDLRFYRAVGVHTMQTLMTGTRPWITAQWTNWLFGRLTWQPDADRDALLTDFCHAAFGDAGTPMVSYYQTLEEAFALVLNQTPDQRGHLALSMSPLALIKDPLADMEDPIHASPETLQRRAADVPMLFALVDAAEAELHTAQQRADSPQLQAEAIAFALTKAWFHFNGHRLRLYATIAANPPAPDMRVHWQAAQRAYREVNRWAEQHLPPLFQQTLKPVQMAMWALRLRRIQADFLTPQWLSWTVDVGSATRLLAGFLQMYGRYKREKRKVNST